MGKFAPKPDTRKSILCLVSILWYLNVVLEGQYFYRWGNNSKIVAQRRKCKAMFTYVPDLTRRHAELFP